MTSIESIVKLIENQQKQIEELRTTINSNKVKYKVIRIFSISVGEPVPFFISSWLPLIKGLPAPAPYNVLYQLQLTIKRFAGSGSLLLFLPALSKNTWLPNTVQYTSMG